MLPRLRFNSLASWTMWMFSRVLMNKEHPALSSQRYAHIMESGTCEGKGNNEATIWKKTLSMGFALMQSPYRRRLQLSLNQVLAIMITVEGLLFSKYMQLLQCIFLNN